MPPRLELTGHRFGKIVVLRMDGRDTHGATTWRCRCDCGVEKTIRGASLKAGTTVSCGCGVAIAASVPRTHGQTGTPLYLRWRAMLDRTGNPKNGEYGNYGGRGIVVCDRWKTSFEAFRDDMADGFEVNLELDRRDVNGPYSPDNCRWATTREQQRNRRNNHRLTFAGRTQTIQEWGEELGIKPNTIITRLRRNWSIERALEVANR